MLFFCFGISVVLFDKPGLKVILKVSQKYLQTSIVHGVLNTPCTISSESRLALGLI